MFNTSPPRRRSDDDRILPLINIVFLLLIFFMLTGRLVSADPFQVSPPTSTSGKMGETPHLVLLIGAKGKLAVDGAIIEASMLEEAVRARLEVEPATQVRIKADGQTDTAQVVGIMEVLRDAGVQQLQLLTVSAIP